MLSDFRTPKVGERSEASHIEILRSAQNDNPHVPCGAPLVEKACAIAWRIIVGRVFYDGNKRTGMEACRLFLKINGHRMRIDDETITMALALATHNVVFGEFVRWVEQRTTEV